MLTATRSGVWSPAATGLHPTIREHTQVLTENKNRSLIVIITGKGVGGGLRHHETGCDPPPRLCKPVLKCPERWGACLLVNHINPAQPLHSRFSPRSDSDYTTVTSVSKRLLSLLSKLFSLITEDPDGFSAGDYRLRSHACNNLINVFCRCRHIHSLPVSCHDGAFCSNWMSRICRRLPSLTVTSVPSCEIL